MIKPETPSESILYSTVRIETDNGVGTGFIINASESPDPKSQVPTLVTNNHVLDGAKKITFILHEGNDGIPTENMIPLVINLPWEYVVPHPDPKIDMCAFPLGSIINDAISKKSKHPFYRCLEQELIPTDEEIKGFLAIEEVLMIGYPIGLSDEVNNFPIARRGITASHPAVDYDGNKEFLVDIACFPGSSGSPVLILNEGTYQTRKGRMIGHSRLHLLGILHAGPVMTIEGNVEVRDIPIKKRTIASTEIMIHLGHVIKAAEIKPLLRAIINKIEIRNA